MDELKKCFDNSFDKNIAETLMLNKDKKDKVDPGIIIHPVIFDTPHPDSPLQTPILSRINFEMLYDANIEALDRKSSFERSGCDDNTVNVAAFQDLSTDQFIIIKNTLLNNIIESTLMSFSNYWAYAKKDILNNVLRFETEFNVSDLNPVYTLSNNINDNIDQLKGFIDGYLQVFKLISMKYLSGEKQFSFEIADYVVEYTDRKSVHLSQFLMSLIVKSINQSLFTYLSNYRVENIIKNSNLLKYFEDNGSNMNITIEQLVGYVLYNSLYSFTIDCLNPSMYNILSSAQGTFFTLYNDLSNKYNNDIL